MLDRNRKSHSWLAVALWALIVLTVQPWQRAAPAGAWSTAPDANIGKGLLLGAVLVVALVLAGPRLSARLPVTYGMYLVYAGAAAAASLSLADPTASGLRAARLFVAVLIPFILWRALIAKPETFLLAHRASHLLVVAVTALGAVLVPALAWAVFPSFGEGGRLQGALLPLLPPRVGEVGAILAGLSAIALVFRRTHQAYGTAAVALGVSILVLSRTRTAAAGLLLGLMCAVLLVRGTPQARRMMAMLFAVGSAGVILAGETIIGWATRQQDVSELSSFTGRTRAWRFILMQPVTGLERLIGHGLGNKQVLLRRGEGDFAGMAIDNSWLTLYWEVGIIGVVCVGLAIGAAVFTVLRAPTPYIRASTGFLVVYTVLSSFTETGLSDLSSQTLHLLVATGAAYGDSHLHRRRQTANVPVAGPVDAQHQRGVPAVSS